jgi:branched-chain amino acid transport system substrate-binding protein
MSLFNTGAAADGVGMYFITTVPTELSETGKEALARYEAQYGQATENHVFVPTVDAVNLVFSAIETVAVQEDDGTLHVGRQALRDALYATKGLEGLAGPLTCDQFGDCRAGSYRIMRLDEPDAGLEGLLSNIVYTFTMEP